MKKVKHLFYLIYKYRTILDDLYFKNVTALIILIKKVDIKRTLIYVNQDLLFNKSQNP